MSSLFSRVSSSGSLTDAFVDNSDDVVITPKSTTKKFSHLFDALSYSNLSNKIDNINEQLQLNICNICREKCITKKYTNNSTHLNLCDICENTDEIKKNWLIVQ